MNAQDVLRYGHLTVLRSIEGVPFSEWERPGVCGRWSVKDILAHLASYEHVLVDVLNGLLDGGPTPALDRFRAEGFNDNEVNQREGNSPEEVLAEYTAVHQQTLALAARIPAERFRQNGALPWYGAEYDLDDFITYTFYGHKREHMAQVEYFRDHVMRK
jgi:uncharacterized protein (TIGR03083 family)